MMFLALLVQIIQRLEILFLAALASKSLLILVMVDLLQQITKIGLRNLKAVISRKIIALQRELERMPKRLKVFTELNKKIKQDLKDHKIIHSESYGINVVVKFDSEKEKNEIVKYCENNKLEYTLCRRYIRVLDNAVSIEVKRVGVNYD